MSRPDKKARSATKSGEPKVRIRRWRESDIDQIVACYQAAYPVMSQEAAEGVPGAEGRGDRESYLRELAVFPEGQFLAEYEGRVIGYATSLIVQLDESEYLYTYQEITGGDTFNTHDASGDTLYGADIAVHPDFRGRGVASRLYTARKRLVKRLNLRRMVAYGRLPGYSAHAGTLSAEEYVEKVAEGELHDPALTTHISAGYRVKQVLLRFFPDKASLDHATLLEWLNEDYNAERRQIAAAPLKGPVRKVRVCSSQFFMRRIDSWEEFKNTVEFFVDTADVYHCHFLVMPELFTTQLIYTMPKTYSWAEAVEALTGLGERYRELLRELAKERRLYIIGGSHPVVRNGNLYNVAHVFSPSGNIYTQDKLHITPGERRDWGIVPGENIRIFETPLARIAVLVCYDIEFPEIARLLALAGVEIIFVPFSTDDRKAYNRVRYTAQARAVENYIYVVLSGNVGNLPTVKNYLLNYGQSAVLAPSDVAFPAEAIVAQADPNVETVVMGDLDLNTLAQQRELGSVRPFFDRRPDLYSLNPVKQIEIIRTE